MVPSWAPGREHGVPLFPGASNREKEWCGRISRCGREPKRRWAPLLKNLRNFRIFVPGVDASFSTGGVLQVAAVEGDPLGLYVGAPEVYATFSKG
jgi:hypothetical protein